MIIFKRTLGWTILSSIVVGIYVAISLSLPEIYTFPREGILGWMIPMSRWIVVPFSLFVIFAMLASLAGLVFLIGWCFNGSWKEVWEEGPFH